MTVTGPGYPAGRPAISRIAHIRAVPASYVPASAASLPASPGAGMARAARLVPARIRHRQPWHLLPRALAAALASLLVMGLLPGQPGFTARGDLAPGR